MPLHAAGLGCPSNCRSARHSRSAWSHWLHRSRVEIQSTRSTRGATGRKGSGIVSRSSDRLCRSGNRHPCTFAPPKTETAWARSELGVGACWANRAGIAAAVMARRSAFEMRVIKSCSPFSALARNHNPPQMPRGNGSAVMEVTLAGA